MTKEKITIHKKNEIVRGTDCYDLQAKRCMNTIYWAVQKHNLYKYTHFDIRFTTLREMMNLKNDDNYVSVIKEALLELKKPIELNNFYHPVKKKKYSWYVTSFLNDAGFYKNEKGEWLVEVEVSSLIKYLMQIEGNFTKLDLIQYLNKFRTKYAMKLYEYLKSFGAYKYLDIPQSHLLKLLNIEDIKKYQYMSQLEILLNRQIKELKKKSDLQDLKVIPMKRDKFFRIIINPKSKKEADKTEAKTALDNLIKRF